MSTRVLVADDSSTMRKIILRSLNAVGVPSAVEAADGEEAIRALSFSRQIRAGTEVDGLAAPGDERQVFRLEILEERVARDEIIDRFHASPRCRGLPRPPA